MVVDCQNVKLFDLFYYGLQILRFVSFDCSFSAYVVNTRAATLNSYCMVLIALIPTKLSIGTALLI